MARVLIIDDDLLVVQLLREHLTNEGYDVATATLAADGLKEAEKNPPDLILLDVQLPDATGFQVCGQFRQRPETKSTPLIMMSGAARSLGQQSLGKNVMGANDYILKPFNVIAVGEKVHALMGDKRPPKNEVLIETPPLPPPAELPLVPEPSPASMFVPENSFFIEPLEPVQLPTPETHLPDISLPKESLTPPPPAPAPEASDEERFYKFSVDVLILVSRLPKTRTGRHLADHLLRCGTAVGAIIQELKSADAEQETSNILKRALKSLHETAYWLMLIRRGQIFEAPSLGDLENQCEVLASQLASKNQPVS